MGIKFLFLFHFSVKWRDKKNLDVEKSEICQCLKFLTDEIIQERGPFFKSELKVYGFFLNH